MMPRMVEGLVGVKVAQITAGLNHTVICTTEGRVQGYGPLGIDLVTVETIMR